MTDRVALISGGAKGIGRGIALALAARGWTIALCYRTSADAPQATCRDIDQAARAAGHTTPPATALQADVSRPDACEHLVKTVLSAHARIDALVHCAGPYHRVDILSETPEGWRAMFDNNLDSLFYLARLVAKPMMEKKWGRILAFSMANADRLAAQPQVTAHYLAKAGVLGLVRTFSKSLAKHKITVNAISPGFVNSGSMEADELTSIAKNIPVGYVGSVDDVVHAALYLLSDDAAYVTGANLQVSGGWGL